MKQNTFDELDELLITIVGENKKVSAKDIHDKVKESYPNNPTAITWSRLMQLVESGYLDIVDKKDELLITKFKIKTR